MNSESRTTILLDSILESDEEEWDVNMGVRVACLRQATCPGCGWCNDQTLASRHSATRIDDMEKSRQQYPRVVSDEANGYTTVYKRKPHQVQTNPGSHTLDMNLSRMQNARVRQDEANGYATVYKVNISQMESDAALARQLSQDELVADMLMEESDAALARQIEESDAALVRQRIIREESASALAVAWHNNTNVHWRRPERI